MLKVLALVPCVDEGGRIGPIVRAMPTVVAQTLVVDDGSRDDTAHQATLAGARVLRFEQNRGVGAALRAGFALALAEGFDAVVVLAGNGKDDPAEIPSLLAPLQADLADFVQGSRWLKRADLGDMPRYRRLATRLHPVLFSLATGQVLTDSTNGFRALHRRVLEAVPLNERWLEGYQLEPWLFAQTLALGFRVVEVPVRKVYPSGAHGVVTKMRPVFGWWQMLEPVLRAAWGRTRSLE
jgi:dolichol-phosphate mannosyltransferase